MQGASRCTFWKSIPLDELIVSQEVAPVANLGELDSIWSERYAFDDALSDVLSDRAHRRLMGKRPD
jgi:hypothetical protein